MQLWGFNSIDVVAVGFFLVSWCGHFWIINSSPLRKRTITYQMNEMRLEWMKSLMKREMKMFDALIQNGFQQGVLFFASSSILIIGALMAGLGSSEVAVDMMVNVPFSTTTTQTAWEIKLLLITFIFVFSFFKFAWSFRQFNYVMIFAGAAPVPGEQSIEEEDLYARKLASMHALAAQNLTVGLNAYFFAMAAFAWFFNAWAFIFATLWVSLVLYRRAFGSRFVKILRGQALYFN